MFGSRDCADLFDYNIFFPLKKNCYMIPIKINIRIPTHTFIKMFIVSYRIFSSRVNIDHRDQEHKKFSGPFLTLKL